MPRNQSWENLLVKGKMEKIHQQLVMTRVKNFVESFDFLHFISEIWLRKVDNCLAFIFFCFSCILLQNLLMYPLATFSSSANLHPFLPPSQEILIIFLLIFCNNFSTFLLFYLQYFVSFFFFVSQIILFTLEDWEKGGFELKMLSTKRSCLTFN